MLEVLETVHLVGAGDAIRVVLRVAAHLEPLELRDEPSLGLAALEKLHRRLPLGDERQLVLACLPPAHDRERPGHLVDLRAHAADEELGPREPALARDGQRILAVPAGGVHQVGAVQGELPEPQVTELLHQLVLRVPLVTHKRVVEVRDHQHAVFPDLPEVASVEGKEPAALDGVVRLAVPVRGLVPVHLLRVADHELDAVRLHGEPLPPGVLRRVLGGEVPPRALPLRAAVEDAGRPTRVVVDSDRHPRRRGCL
mmetsp:Transcript_52147/g.153888  ORF Transcript_52147/g.153888 Transcript_52147/m.153888 type:complete len:255 (+) Transcript_52147:497-1261(+)